MTLADRIEQAEGPSRELDAEIALLVGAPCGRRSGWSNADNGDYYVIDECAPAYTASIDAALTLVPEGMRDEIEITTLYQVARVAINLNHGPDDGPYYGSNARNSIPLAICAAALRTGENNGR